MEKSKFTLFLVLRLIKIEQVLYVHKFAFSCHNESQNNYAHKLFLENYKDNRMSFDLQRKNCDACT